MYVQTLATNVTCVRFTQIPQIISKSQSRHESRNISKSRSYVTTHIIDKRTARVIYSSSSLAHDSATMALESHSRQSLGEDVCRLILICDLVEIYFRLVSRSKFPDSMNASVNMLGACIHATPFDEENTCRYDSRRRLLIFQKLQNPPEIQAIERALRHAVELAFRAANGGHWLTLRRPCYYCPSEHDGTSTDTPAIIGSSMICICADRELVQSCPHPNSQQARGSTAPRLYVMPRDRVLAR